LSQDSDDESSRRRSMKHPWSKDEDKLLSELVEEHGPRKWSLIAQSFDNRLGKQCRERWVQHLQPSVVKGAWTEEEDKVIMEGVARLGTKWNIIAKDLPGRTDNAIKNRWNSTMRKFAKQQRRRKGVLSNPADDDGALVELEDNQASHLVPAARPHADAAAARTDLHPHNAVPQPQAMHLTGAPAVVAQTLGQSFAGAPSMINAPGAPITLGAPAGAVALRSGAHVAPTAEAKHLARQDPSPPASSAPAQAQADQTSAEPAGKRRKKITADGSAGGAGPVPGGQGVQAGLQGAGAGGAGALTKEERKRVARENNMVITQLAAKMNSCEHSTRERIRCAQLLVQVAHMDMHGISAVGNSSAADGAGTSNKVSAGSVLLRGIGAVADPSETKQQHLETTPAAQPAQGLLAVPVTPLPAKQGAKGRGGAAKADSEAEDLPGADHEGITTPRPSPAPIAKAVAAKRAKPTAPKGGAKAGVAKVKVEAGKSKRAREANVSDSTTATTSDGALAEHVYNLESFTAPDMSWMAVETSIIEDIDSAEQAAMPKPSPLEARKLFPLSPSSPSGVLPAGKSGKAARVGGSVGTPVKEQAEEKFWMEILQMQGDDDPTGLFASPP